MYTYRYKEMSLLYGINRFDSVLVIREAKYMYVTQGSLGVEAKGNRLEYVKLEQIHVRAHI